MTEKRIYRPISFTPIDKRPVLEINLSNLNANLAILRDDTSLSSDDRTNLVLSILAIYTKPETKRAVLKDIKLLDELKVVLGNNGMMYFPERRRFVRNR